MPTTPPSSPADSRENFSPGPDDDPPFPHVILSTLRPLARLLAEGEAATDLDLTSEELGPLRFRIRTVNGGGLSLRVEAGRSLTLAYLRDHAADLAAVMADLGVSRARLTWGLLSSVDLETGPGTGSPAAEVVLPALRPAPGVDALDILL